MNQIKQAIQDVFDTLKPGLTEAAYQKALTLRLQLDFKIVERERSVPVIYLNHEIATCRADIVVDNQYIIELKAVTSSLSTKDKQQLKRYQSILGINQGILVNFGKEPLEVLESNLTD